MIKLTAYSPAAKQRIVYTDYFRTQRDNLLMLAEAQSHIPFFEHVQRTLHQAIQQLSAQLRETNDPEPTLKEFFVQLNWQLHTLLGKTLSASDSPNPEHGMSLFFAFVRGDVLYAVQFGRMLCAQVSGDRVEIIGQAWENFAIRTRDEMNLIGGKAEDIAVKVHTLSMPRGSRFVVVSSHAASDVKSLLSSQELADKLKESGQSFAVFETRRPALRYKPSFFKGKPFRFSAIALIVVIILTSLYFYQCNNEVEDQLSVMRQLRLYMERNQDPERVPEMLGEIARVMLPDADTLQIDRIVGEARAFVTTPASKLTLKPDWRMKLPGEVTLAPAFDNQRLFITCGAEVHVYSKDRQKPLYVARFDHPVERLMLSDANRFLVTTDDGITHSLKKDSGEITWAQPGSDATPVEEGIAPTPISFVQDRRLAASVLVFVRADQLQVVNIHTGSVVTTYAAETPVSRLSSFDPIEKALYAVEGRELVKLWLEVR